MKNGTTVSQKNKYPPDNRSTIKIAVCLLVVAVAAAFGAPAEAAKLGAYNVDKTQSSVSGISSGGYMAVQMGVAYSATFKGVGVFAGGPYNCAQGDVFKALGDCMNGSPSVSAAINVTNSRSSSGSIDNKSNIANQKIYLFSGTLDTTVRQSVMDSLDSYYLTLAGASDVRYVNNINAVHTMPTTDYGNACTTSASPYISDCNYDGAGEALQQMYGTLNPKNTGTLSGQFVAFDQTEFRGSFLASTGYAYVPASCAAQQRCKVHVAFHGCLQNTSSVGSAYYRNAGYNAWADTNNIIVLYPQTTQDALHFVTVPILLPPFFMLVPVLPVNPNGCWDWWGYTGSNYDVKSGSQMKAVKAMVDRIASGFKP